MIPVAPQPEPADFEANVRHPGRSFLSACASLSEVAWKKHSYWRRIFPELYAAFRGICSYSCHWLPRDSGAGTVDHFRPKARYPDLAYDWSNYRLANLVCNGRKGDHEDVLDPFEVKAGWFILDFPSLLVRPDSKLAGPPRDRVQATIDRLCLNHEAVLETRLQYLQLYCSGEASLHLLRAWAPFIVAELERQDFLDAIREIMTAM